MRKIAKKNCYKVMNRKTKRVFAKCTTKEKAKKQLRLLNAIEYNKNFVPRNRTVKSKSKSKSRSR